MKARNTPLKVHVTTLGCAKNLVDSERLMGRLRAAGLKVEHESSARKADIAILNTCGFIGDAKEESVDTILSFVEAKNAGKIGRLFVMGCLSQRYKEDLKNEIPDVDGFFGVNEQDELVKAMGIDFRRELIGERLLTTPPHYAYLKIAEGCDRECSFCAIPLIRGKQISLPVESLLEEAESLISQGVKEFNVIAQDTTLYGMDLYGERRLAQLMSRLSEVPGMGWLRLHYAYPLGFPTEVLDVMRESDTICNYLDIPLQHINSGLLKSMKRGVSKEKTLKLLDTIRGKVPGIALRTSLIVGYPGETQKEFEELLDFVRLSRFERLGVFTYSPEEDTAAFSLGDPVSDEVKRERADILMSVQGDISLEINESRIGSVQKVIIDRHEDSRYIGRTQYDSPEVDNEVLIDAAGKKLKIGEFYDVKITGADYFDLDAALLPTA